MRKIIIIFMLPCLLYSGTKYVLPCRQDLLLISERIALSLAGTKELGNRNDGPLIREIQKSAGLPRFSAYCAAGQYWSFLQACRCLNLPENEIPIPRTGLANYMFNFAARNGRSSFYQATRHDLLVWKYSQNMHGHIERIIHAGKAGWVQTIAFNTTLNVREGIFIRKRNIYHLLGRMNVRGLIGFIPKEAAQ